ncbi:methyl-accepting chemotaxis protein [Peribacillus sp. SCS-155]|uniref:methyl-accepting chemotaxis protein n=1 Tax=Peribacillus sedimenti TaxID=3115297 RepID=UPI0039057A2B
MKLSIKQKLIGSFLIVCLIFGISSFFAYKNAKGTDESYKYLISTVSELRSITQSIQTDIALQVGYYRAYMLYENEDMRTKLHETNDRISESIQKGRELATLPETKEKLGEIEKANQEFVLKSDQIMDAVKIDREKAITDGLEQIVPISTDMTDKSQSLYTWLKEDVLDKRVKETQDHSKAGISQVMLFSVIATVLAIGSGIIISLLISRPITALAKITEQVASGNLNVRKLKLKSKDEIYNLNESFEKMTVNLRDMISGIASNSDQVAASAEQLTASAEQSSKASETVASAIQEIAGGTDITTVKLQSNSSSLNEVLEGVLRISESSTNVTELSRNTTVQAEEGGKYVEDNLAQMRFIHESVSRSNDVIGSLAKRSKEIGEILDVINGIAEQTNLLALNAAIEAARAGEHGKGFAVVADEVRKLAEQSQSSTKNIAHLINMIQKDTEESVIIMNEVVKNAEAGVKVSEQTSEKFSLILDSTRGITPQIEEVTATVQQISASIEEVSSAAYEISSLAKANAASTEEVAASTEEQLASMEEIDSSAQALAMMAEELKVLVNRFKL